MAQTTDFTNVATEHPNYFPGQYLLEDDFALQHKYLIDRIRYQNQSLHVSGIIEGLEVERIDDKIAVQIGSGSAIDSQGHLIVFINENDGKGKEFSDFNNINEGELYIKYNEDYNSKSLQENEFENSYTRWQENPTFGFDTRTPDDCVKLATLTISESGEIINVDLSIREYSGLSLPNSNGEALTLRSGGNANPNVAVLTGSLQIDENLTVAGTGTSSFAGKLEVTGDVGLGTTNQAGYKLTVQGNQYLDGDLDVRGTIAGNLTVNGAMTPSVGNNNTNGIMFPENAFGSSSGDAAWIRYYRRGGNGIATTLEIGISDDDNDHIALMPVKGGVGIGINDPGSYKLNVEGNQYISGSLTVKGTIYAEGNPPVFTQEMWHDPTFENGWENYSSSYNPARYFKDSLGIVHLIGVVYNGDMNKAIFTLPPGYRPSRTEIIPVLARGNKIGIGVLAIYWEGYVVAEAEEKGWISLNGITFRAGSPL